MIIVTERIEKKRLNGYRIPGELYLVGSLPVTQLEKIPFELSQNLVPKMGLQPKPDGFPYSHALLAGMMWVNGKHYSHAAHFMQEARQLQVQMRIKRVSCSIEPGRTVVLLAHRKAIVDYSNGCNGWVNSEGEAETDIQYKPGVFSMFTVRSMEYVIKDETDLEDKYIIQLAAAGVKLVKVIHSEEMESADLEDDGKEIGYE